MAPSSDAFSSRSLRESLPELSFSSSTTRPSTTSSRLAPPYSSHPSSSHPSSSHPSSSQNYGPGSRSPRGYASPSSYSSASRSSSAYEIPPPNYDYIPSTTRTTSSKPKHYPEASKAQVHNNSDRGFTDPYVRSKHHDGRYHLEPSSKSGTSEREKIAREKAREAEKKINGTGKGRDKRREPEVVYYR